MSTHTPTAVGSPSQLFRATALVGGLFLIGTVGYRLVEGASWWDSFYMTVITITTVGFSEAFPLSQGGQALTVVLLIAGLGIFSSWRPRSGGRSWKANCGIIWDACGDLA
jgi:hypothetical protein